MPGIEQLLGDVLGKKDGAEKSASAPGAVAPAATDDVLDVAAFSQKIASTADELEKTAESLSVPGLAEEQLRMLENPLDINKGALHEQHKKLVATVLPEAANSLSIPQSVDAIQKSASTGGWLLKQLGRG